MAMRDDGLIEFADFQFSMDFPPSAVPLTMTSSMLQFLIMLRRTGHESTTQLGYPRGKKNGSKNKKKTDDASLEETKKNKLKQNRNIASKSSWSHGPSWLLGLQAAGVLGT
jgi:hypothetical protein